MVNHIIKKNLKFIIISTIHATLFLNYKIEKNLYVNITDLLY